MSLNELSAGLDVDLGIVKNTYGVVFRQKSKFGCPNYYSTGVRRVYKIEYNLDK